jgi:hypothetical protein
MSIFSIKYHQHWLCPEKIGGKNLAGKICGKKIGGKIGGKKLAGKFNLEPIFLKRYI